VTSLHPIYAGMISTSSNIEHCFIVWITSDWKQLEEDIITVETSLSFKEAQTLRQTPILPNLACRSFAWHQEDVSADNWTKTRTGMHAANL